MITLKGNIANLEGTSGDQKPIGVPVNTIFRELDTNCSYYYTGETWVEIPSSGGGGGGGTENYNELENKPQIAGVTLSGNKTLANLGIQGELTFDDAPTDGSSNPVTSDGIYEALGSKQGTLTFDDTPTDGSSNPVTSDGIYEALSGKQDTLTFEGTYNASTNKAATESTVSDAIGALTNSDVGLDNVTNNEQVKAVSGSVTSGGIVTFGADGATVSDSGKTIETSLSDSNDKIPTSKSIIDNAAGSEKLTGYTTDSSQANITSSSTVTDAIEQLDYRTATNKTNILLLEEMNGAKNLIDWSIVPSSVGTDGNVHYTYTNNSISITGTKSVTNSYITWAEGVLFEANTDYVAVNEQSSSQNVDIRLSIYGKINGSWVELANTGTYKAFNTNNSTEYMVRFIVVCDNGTTVSKTVKPMIITKSAYDAGFTDYQPYALPNTTITPALVECVDNGAKNFSTITGLSKDTTTAGFASETNFGVTIPAGTYVISYDLTRSDNTKTGVIGFRDVDNTYTDTGYYWTTATHQVQTVTFSKAVKAINMYVGAGTTCTLSNLMICKEEVYKASPTYQPYAMDNIELTNELTPTAYEAVTPVSDRVSVIVGGYIKVGNIVIVNIRCTISDTISQSDAFIQGLPKPIVVYNEGYGAISVSNNLGKIINILGNGNMGYSDATAISSGTLILSAVYVAK